MVIYMDLFLIIGVIILAYIAAVVTALTSEKKPIEALTGGTIAWIVVFIISFIITLDTLLALLAAIAFGIVTQLIVQTKRELDAALESRH